MAANLDTLETKEVLVVGAGALAAPAVLALAGAGVGRIVLVDGDEVESGELGWQPILRREDVGRPRAAALAERLARLFPGRPIRGLAAGFDAPAATTLVAAADLVVACGGACAASFAAGDAAVAAGRPLVYGAALGTTAQVLTVEAGATGCLRCLFEEAPPPGSIPGRAEAGMLGPLAGIAGALLGAEAARVVAGSRGWYAGRLLTYEARTARARVVPVARRQGCAACGALQRGVAA